MLKKYLFIISQVLIIISYFFDILKDGRGDDAIPVMGYEALFLNAYYIIGNVLMGLILLSAVGMVFLFLRIIIQNEVTEKQDQFMTIFSNVQLFSGMIFATFLGTFLAFGGYIVIALIVISAYVNYIMSK
jgi:hypothetical protein